MLLVFQVYDRTRLWVVQILTALKGLIGWQYLAILCRWCRYYYHHRRGRH